MYLTEKHFFEGLSGHSSRHGHQSQSQIALGDGEATQWQRKSEVPTAHGRGSPGHGAHLSLQNARKDPYQNVGRFGFIANVYFRVRNYVLPIQARTRAQCVVSRATCPRAAAARRAAHHVGSPAMPCTAVSLHQRLIACRDASIFRHALCCVPNTFQPISDACIGRNATPAPVPFRTSQY